MSETTDGDGAEVEKDLDELFEFPRLPNQSGDEYPPEYRRPIQRYVNQLYRTADDDDDEARNTKTVDDYQQDFNWFELFLRENDLGIHDIDPFTALDIGTMLGDKLAGSTAGTRYRNISKLYGFLRSGGLVDSNPFDEWDMKDDCGISENTSMQSKQLEDGERYGPTIDEIRLMEENAGEEHRLRNQCIIRLLFNTGCRSGELRQIRLEDIDWDKREIALPGEICKYNKPRTVTFTKGCKALLRDWVEDGYRDNLAYGGWSEYLFPTGQSACISTDTVEDVVTDAAERAGLNRDLWTDANGRSRQKVTPHNLRYACGYYMLFDENDEPREDANIYQVSNYLGHSSVTVTERVYIEDNPRAGVHAGHELMPDYDDE